MGVDQKHHWKFRVFVVQNGFDKEQFIDAIDLKQNLLPVTVLAAILTQLFLDLINRSTAPHMLESQLKNGGGPQARVSKPFILHTPHRSGVTPHHTVRETTAERLAHQRQLVRIPSLFLWMGQSLCHMIISYSAT